MLKSLIIIKFLLVLSINNLLSENPPLTSPPHQYNFFQSSGLGFTYKVNFKNNINNDLLFNEYILDNNILNYNFSYNYIPYSSDYKTPNIIDKVSLSYEIYRLNTEIQYFEFLFSQNISNDFINLSIFKNINIGKIKDIKNSILFMFSIGYGFNPNVKYFGINEDEFNKLKETFKYKINEKFDPNYKLGLGIYLQNTLIPWYAFHLTKSKRLLLTITPYYGFEIEYINIPLISTKLNYKVSLGIEVFPYFY